VPERNFVPMTLAEARREIGSRVTFNYFHGELAVGIITSTNDKNVFVRFKHYPGAPSEACDPERLELTPVDDWFYLSFVDRDLPNTGEGSQFVGACLVPAETLGEAVTVCHVLGLNPGGEVQAIGPLNGEQLRSDGMPADQFGRLLKREDIYQAVSWPDV
jgi:hypothetical protein